MPVCGHCDFFNNPNEILEETDYKRTRECEKGREVDALYLSCHEYAGPSEPAGHPTAPSTTIAEALSKSEKKPEQENDSGLVLREDQEETHEPLDTSCNESELTLRDEYEQLELE